MMTGSQRLDSIVLMAFVLASLLVVTANLHVCLRPNLQQNEAQSCFVLGIQPEVLIK